jgi:hypothetical protein
VVRQIRLSWKVACFILAFPLAAIEARPDAIANPPGTRQTDAATATYAPLFDSVDENLNPVSMADLIDGKPLVMACTSCT